MKLIENNPFRMLGIPVNATAKDLAANKGKFKLLDIGKEVSFPLDLPGVLTPVQRTKEAVVTAEHSINLPHDKIMHALFWFAQPSDPIGKLGYDHLLQGLTDSAIDKLQRSSSWESLLCLATLRLQQGNSSSALAYMDRLIDERCDEFVHAVAGQTRSEDVSALRHEYIARLTKEVSAIDLLVTDSLSESMRSELRAIAVEEPIRVIEKAIATAKSADDKDADAQLQAGRTLMNETKKPLQQLRQVIDSADSRYNRLSDKLANAIMQCSINYYNKIEGENRTIIDNALALAEYANRIARGKMTKDHIQHNIDILKEKKSKIPPAGLEEHDATIKASILKHIMIGGQTIDNAIALMKDCAPHIVAIKERQEIDTSLRNYYLNISTQVVNAALSSIIEEHNKVQNEAQQSANNGLGIAAAMARVQTMLKKTWKATLMMDKFDKEDAFRTGRYMENRDALREMCDGMPGVNVSTMQIGYSDIDLRTEEEVFSSCRTSLDYRSYISRYPKGKYISEARQRQQALSAKEEEHRKIREQQERERKQREEQQRKEREEQARREREEAERKELTWQIVKWGSIIGGVIICVASGTGWGILVGGIGYFIAKVNLE